MSRPQPGQMPSRMAVLALVREEAGTVSGIRERLAKAFPSFAFAESVADNALRRLAEEGHVCKAYEDPCGGRARDFYEITAEGDAHFTAWLRAASSIPPAIRETLYARLAFSKPEDVPYLLKALHVEQEVCAAKFVAAGSRLRVHQAAHHGNTGWTHQIQEMVLADEALLWADRLKRLKRFRVYLEGRIVERGGGHEVGDG